MIRVLVVDDHPVLRAGLEAVLRSEPGFLCVGVAAEARDRVLHRAAPDVVVLDRRLGDEDGLACARTAALRSPTRPRSRTNTADDSPEHGPPGARAAGAGGALVAKERDIGASCSTRRASRCDDARARAPGPSAASCADLSC